MADEATPQVEPATGSIHKRMIAILGELPAIGKDTRNPQQGFMYRSHDDVLNALNPLLAKHGVYVIPSVHERIAAERTTDKGKTMYEVNLLVHFTFYGAECDEVTASAWGEGTDMGDKATNKAMTMAFKNVLAQSFAVSTSETIDTDSESPGETTRSGGAGERPISQGQTKQIEQIVGNLDAAGVVLGPGNERVYDFFLRRTSIHDLTYDQAHAVILALKKPTIEQDATTEALEAIIGPPPPPEPV